MRRALGFATLIALGAAPALAQQGPLNIQGNDRSVSQSCAGRNVTITGNENAVRLTGGCRSLRVQGNGNAVTAEMAPGAPILVVGNNTRVEWTLSGRGAEPTVQITGNGSAVAPVGSGQPRAAAPAQPAAGPLVIEGNALDRTADCAGREVQLRGNAGNIVLRGGCRAVLVEGEVMRVRAELAPGARIGVRGNVVQVLWTLAGTGAEPTVQANGELIEIRRAGPANPLGAGTPAVMQEDTAGGVRLTVRGDVLFDFDADRLRGEAAQVVGEIADLIRTQNPRAIRITGHTDSVGDDAYNLDLSLRRARNVAAALAARGPLPAVNVEGLGETQPVAANARPDGSDNPEGRQRNRRVEILLER
jgi:outer membrane protein OmpA-like peptidoglycan-associated protein